MQQYPIKKLKKPKNGLIQSKLFPNFTSFNFDFQFIDGVKPMWEDEGNKKGGHISMLLKKDATTIIWEELVLALVGGDIPNTIKDEINGVVVQVREKKNFVQIWFRNYQSNIITELEQWVKQLLQVPEEARLEIKQFFRTGGFDKSKVIKKTLV